MAVVAAVATIVVAAGEGRRLGAAEPKALVPLAGRPLLLHSLERLSGLPGLLEQVVVVPPGWRARVEERFAAEFARWKVSRVVEGGVRRQDSAAAGFAALSPGVEVVLIHDAARPLVRGPPPGGGGPGGGPGGGAGGGGPRPAPRGGGGAAGGGGGPPPPPPPPPGGGPPGGGGGRGGAPRDGAALLAVPLSDTLKREGPEGRVGETLDRRGLWRAQTPQGFRREVYAAAMRRAMKEGGDATDDASLVERAGGAVTLVEGDPSNLKITTAADLRAAEALLREEAGT